jgi:hypothetical protein
MQTRESPVSMKGKRWKLALAAVGAIVALQLAASGLVRTPQARAYLLAHLERTFGRRVEVREFTVSLLPSPQLDAQEISVSEDPAFGNEYFLRAERLSAGLRWLGLLRGRFEFGTVSLTRPSLTLVRNGEGRWNLEQWLPPGRKPAGNTAGSQGSAPEAVTNRLEKIDIEEGRVSFKLGEDKKAFAFVEVSGSIQQAAPGRWELELEAEPWRSGVQLQSTGTIRVRGEVAGTSSRLQPAHLQIHWEDASLADMFRLVRGQDTGVRGTFAVDATAESGMKQPDALPGGEWSFVLQARAGQIHRWDLTERSDNPRLSFRLRGRWNPATGNVKADEMLVEAPKSNLRGTALLVSKPKTSFEIHVDSAGIQAEDLLSWYRAFQHGVADGVQAQQYFTGAMTLSGWPLSLDAAAFSSRGGTVVIPGLRTPVRIGSVRGGLEKRDFVLEPVTISFGGAAPGEIAVARKPSLPAKQKTMAPGLAVSLKHDFDSHAGAVSVEGRIAQVEEVLRAAATLGRQLNFGWEMTGEASSGLQWKWSMTSGPVWDGSIDFSHAKLQVAGLNQALALQDVRLVWNAGKKSVQIAKAEGFGAEWSGQIVRADPLDVQEGIQWNFDLHADHLDAAELDRWVGPRARPGWVQRLLASLLGTAQPSVSASELLRRVNARGVLRADEFDLEKLKFKQVRAEGELKDLHLTLRQADAQWAGGTLRARMIAEFSPQPHYEFSAQFERVNLAQIPLAGKVTERFGGAASGSIQLETGGIGRDVLLQKLRGGGKVQLHSVEFRGWDVAGSLASGTPRSGFSRWTAGNGVFRIADKNLELTELKLTAPWETILLQGNVSFARQADLTLEAAGSGSRRGRFTALDHVLTIAGPLDGPKVSLKGKIAQQPGG